MADDNGNKAPAAPQVDAGTAFRIEMWFANFMLGNWPYLVLALVLALFGVFLYGQYGSYYRATQRALASDIAFVEVDEPHPGFQGYSDPDKAKLVELADKLVAIADTGRGPARVEALLKAAEWYRIADATDKRRSALEAAEKDATDVLRYSAVAALANLDIEAGNEAEAERRLRSLVEEKNEFFAQQATLDLGYAYEHFGKSDQARQLYEKFLVDWPEAPGADAVRDRLAALGTNG